MAAGFFGQLGLEMQSDQCGGLQDSRRRFGQLGEPAADDVVHAIRYLRRPSAVGVDEGQQFGEEEGVAVGPLVQGLQHLGGEVQPSQLGEIASGVEVESGQPEAKRVVPCDIGQDRGHLVGDVGLGRAHG